MLHFRSQDVIVVNLLYRATVYIPDASGGGNGLIRVHMVQSVSEAVECLQSAPENFVAIFIDADQLSTDVSKQVIGELEAAPEPGVLPLLVWPADEKTAPLFEDGRAIAIHRPVQEADKNRQIRDAVSAHRHGGHDAVRLALQKDAFPHRG